MDTIRIRYIVYLLEPMVKPRIAACRDYRRWLTTGLLGTLQNTSRIEFKFLPTSGDVRAVLLELLEMVSRGRKLPDRVSMCCDISPFLPVLPVYFLAELAWLRNCGVEGKKNSYAWR
jgi:hypothetical protein